MPSLVFTKNIKGLYCYGRKTKGFLPTLIDKLTFREAREWCSHLEPFLRGKKLLDVGFGTGNLSCFFARKGYRVRGVDVAERSLYEDLKPEVYNGSKLPYKKNEFDTAFVVHTLHHCENPARVLSEAKRVAKRVVFLEDTYKNLFEHVLTASIDKLLNFEFYPHQHKSAGEWEKIVKDRGWKIVAKKEWVRFPHPTLYGRFCLFAIEG